MTEPTRYPAKPQQSISQVLFRRIGDPRSRFSATAALCALLFASAPCGHSQTPGIAEKPYRGWSSFSQQTISSNFLTQANMAAQSDALLSSGLQTHGFDFINIDSGWQGSFDANGRPIPNSTTFPDIAALVVGAGLQIGLFVVIAQRMRIEELTGLIGMVRSKLGR